MGRLGVRRLVAAGLVLLCYGCASSLQAARDGESSAADAEDAASTASDRDEERAGAAGTGDAGGAPAAGAGAVVAPPGAPATQGSAGGAPGTAGSPAGPGAPAASGTAAGAPGTAPQGAGSPGSAGGATGPGSQGSGGQPVAPAPGTAPAPAPAPGAAPPPPAPAVRTGRGVSDTALRVGIIAIDWAGLQNVEGYSTGNPYVQTQAIADAINAEGGIRGRQVELFVEEVAATSNNMEADEQRACASFTQDSEVFAIVPGLLTMSKTLPACAAQNGTVLVHGAGGVFDDTTLQEYSPYLYAPAGPSLTRMAAFYADGLAQQGFFQAADPLEEVRVGLVIVDDAPFARAAEQVLVPRLAAAGVDVVEQVAVQAQDGLTRTASQMPNVVLRFQQAGINRVLFLDNGGVAALFAIQAAQQAYFPLYGLNTPTLPVTMQANVPAVALQGAIGVGWQPPMDVSRQYEEVSPAAQRCYDIMANAAQSDVDRAGEWSQRQYCDALFFLDVALETAPSLDPEGLAAATAALGTSYASTLTWQTAFNGGRRDGGTAVANFAFMADCSCFQYSGPVTSIG